MFTTSKFHSGVKLLKFLRSSVQIRTLSRSAVHLNSDDLSDDLSDFSDLFEDAKTDLSEEVNKLYQTAVNQTPALAAARSTGSILCETDSKAADHSDRQHAMFYTVPNKDVARYFKQGLRDYFYTLSTAVDKTSVMIREPAIEIMNFLRHSNYKLPVNRYILYGREGAGKSTSLAHLMHHCGSQDWVVLHIPWTVDWIQHEMYKRDIYKEVELSTYKTGRVDSPIAATEWLSYFWSMNSELISKLNVVTENKYIWNRRESTEIGVPLQEAIDFGINRAKYASDVVGLVLKEIKQQSSKGKFKTLVAIDGVNGFFQMTEIRREDDFNKFYHTSELTLVHNFKKLLSNDWTGGAVVCTVDPHANNPESGMTDSYMPRYVLGKEGFQWFDPHIPVFVPHYSNKEINSCLDYYTANNWLQHPAASTPKGRKEMIFLSGHNPLDLFKVSQMW